MKNCKNDSVSKVHEFAVGNELPSHHAFPDMLRQLRETNNYSQQFIAQKLNISPQGYGYYERGQRRMMLPMMAILADFYHVNIMEFVRLELSDFDMALSDDFLSEMEASRNTPTKFPLKPGCFYEQVSQTEYLLLDYYRSLPRKVKRDIELFLNVKRG